MNLSELLDMWQVDTKIDVSELVRESLNVPMLHSKYLKYFSNERLKLRSIKFKQADLNRKLSDYYKGDLNTPEDLEELGRPPYQFKRLKQEVDRYVESDKEMVALNIKVSYQTELVEVLEEIVKSINMRGFVIKNTIDALKFNNPG